MIAAVTGALATESVDEPAADESEHLAGQQTPGRAATCRTNASGEQPLWALVSHESAEAALPLHPVGPKCVDQHGHPAIEGTSNLVTASSSSDLRAAISI